MDVKKKDFIPERFLSILSLPIWKDLQNGIAEISGLPIGIYDRQWKPLLKPTIDNKFTQLVLDTQRGREIFEDFYSTTIRKALRSSKPLIIRSPINQYFFISTLRLNNEPLFIIGGDSYVSYEDFSNFIENAHRFGLSHDQITPLTRELTFRDSKTIVSTARFVHTTIQTILKHLLPQKVTLNTIHRQKAILGFISEFATFHSHDELSQQAFQAFSILFNVESMNMMLRDGAHFVTAHAFGSLREYLEGLRLKADRPILQRAVTDQEPLYIEGLYHILEAGLSDKVTSAYIFPFIKDGETTGLINIYNTRIPEEDKEIVCNFIQILSFTWDHLRLKENQRKIKQEVSIFSDIHKTIGSILEEERLYDMILEKSTELINAEQGSLMVFDPDKEELTIKAAKGINKKLAEYLKVKLGEGIAGKVCKDSTPLIVENVEEDPRIEKRNRPRYKTKSFISIPLKLNNRNIGVLNITDKITGKVFSEDDLRLLQHFASYASIAIERSEFFRISEDLRRISITDSLTGLLNRRYFQERLAEEMERSKRHHYPLSLIMIDIDNFKPFNDSRGHIAGDEALRAVAKTIREAVRTIDVVSRYGGEEFAVILPQTEKESSKVIAERIRTEVSKTTLPHRELPPAKLTISLGLASYPDDARDIENLVNSADRALYKAKATGKNRVCISGK